MSEFRRKGEQGMALEFCSFASGSSGNCYLVKTENTKLLVDVGITGKRIIAGLDGQGLCCEDLDGILLTHEHTDHVQSIRMIARKAKTACVVGSEGTLNRVRERVPEGRLITICGGAAVGTDVEIGDIQVIPFSLSHDAAEPVGYSFRTDGRQITIVTDTGCVTEEIFGQIRRADLLVLEANHEVNILKMGPYPYPLKRRILGDEGHLSNDTAGQVLCRMLEERKEKEEEDIPKVLLAHLSRENNTPQQAYLTVQNILFENGFYVDRDLKLTVILRDEESPLFTV